MNETFQGTTKQLAEKLGVSYQDAQGLVNFLSVKGLAIKKGELRKEGAKGKPSTIWEIPTEIKLY